MAMSVANMTRECADGDACVTYAPHDDGSTEVEQLLSEAVRERNELSEKIAKLSESSAMAKDDPVKTVEVESKTSDNKISEKTLESTTMDKAIDNKTQDVILEVARQPKSVRHLPAVADADMEPQYRK